MRTIFVLMIFLILTSYSYSQEPADGRWLDEETWQPRNQHATIDNSPGSGGDWPVIAEWGPEIAISSDYIYVVWWYLYGDTIYFVRSTDGGLNWGDNRRISELNMWNAAIPKISASGSNVYVVYRGWLTYQGIYLQRSTDYGVSWLPTQALYITARNYGGVPTIVAKQNNVYIVFRIHIDLKAPITVRPGAIRCLFQILLLRD